MAFCGNCGAQMEATERFCVKCGRDVTVRPAATPIAAVPTPAAPPVQPMAAMPSAYAPPAAMPSAYTPPASMPVAVMPQAQPNRGGMMGVIVVLLALAGGGYYYYTHYIKPTPPASQPQSNPNPGPNPPSPGPGGGSNAALVKAQDFEAQWQNVSGMIQLNNETWKNNGTVTVQSATLECDQLDANGNTLDEMRTTLNGPVAAGATDGFSPFTMGATAANTTKVNCQIVHVKLPAAPGQ